MKASDSFKTIISDHLLSLAINDPLFAETLNKPNKNIDDCTTYILNQVQKSGQVGFADAEIFGMAVHYYDEDVIEVGKTVNARVVVNHHVDAPAKPVVSETAQRFRDTPTPQPKPVKKVVSKVIENQTALF
ncbi:PcfK-like protein [Mucilaginibacter lappiensis]|uniref:L-ascorbate metabolism protein UlaG (Beta-lactamase superfamily) n=1 Tax=Mucilaginibacter lappiensis TaxID=354630 RepID=A0ABR6PKL0_9SPHI|nr:PcfK-like family protein [Mucilaginibacter lappiensis]MBB6109754.1 L-ascorbate metabolism protein UlaG (beta-lactamase superfamily) [Mucilaginibacter lappiensis]SIR14382.1 PcfK-like protein [Mucilaginibacter lappiensis]